MMAKKKKMDKTLMQILTFVLTALGTGVLGFGVGVLFQWLNDLLGNYYPIVQLVGIGAFFLLAMKLRKGKETAEVFAKTVVTSFFIMAFYIALDMLPFKIPYLSFIVGKDLLSGTLMLSLIWTAESVVKRFVK